MRVVPVIDLMGGVVVRGLRGERRRYRPIESQLAADASPVCVARGFIDHLGLRTAYLADLDAIGGAKPAWGIYSQLIELGMNLWVDAGVSDPRRAGELAEFSSASGRLEAVIVGLESVAGPDAVAKTFEKVGPERFIFSLDLRHGSPLRGGAAWAGLDAWRIANEVLTIGVRRMIVLDLGQVGAGEGVGTEDLCRRLRAADRELQIIAGGGVRRFDDVQAMSAAGCDIALVASALHDGRITRQELDFLSRDGA